MGCCGGSRKKEVFSARQKWDYINLNDFRSRSCWSPTGYFFFWLNAFFGVAVVAADCYTAVNLLIFDRWSSKIDPFIDFSISKWIFTGCILFSFLLIGFHSLWSIRAIKSNSVARGYLNIYAQRWYCFGRNGYKRFLVFAELTKSKHGSDYVMLYTYFSFKGWAQVLLADGPRQVLNGMTLYSVTKAKLVPGTEKDGISGLLSSIKALSEESLTQSIILSVMLFTCVIWVFAFLQLAFAIFLWIMFIWHHVPSGHNLGSYCREKIDKRLVGIVAKNHKRTLEEEREERLKAAQAGGGGRAPTLPVLGAGAGGAPPSIGISKAPTMMSMNEKPGLSRTDTIGTFTTTVSSKADLSMPTRPGMAARPTFPARTSTETSNASSMFDDSASLLGANRKDPFQRTNTPMVRTQPPIGPYARANTFGSGPNSSQQSLNNMYDTAPAQPHDFLGHSQALPPINRNDTISPFQPGFNGPVNRNDTISPFAGALPAPQLPSLNFDSPVRSNTPQGFPPAGPGQRRFPVRPQDSAYGGNLAQSPSTYSSPPGSDFSTYTEHRHTPPIHHKPQNEVFEMDGGFAVSEPIGGAVEMGSTPPKPISKMAPSNDTSNQPIVFELDSGVDIVPQNTAQNQPRSLTPPQVATSTTGRSNTPPQQQGYSAYNKPTYQSQTTSAPPQQYSEPSYDSFDREEHGVGRNQYGNYDVESSSGNQYSMEPPRPMFNQPHGSRPGTPQGRAPPPMDNGYDNQGGYGGYGMQPPARSMTAAPPQGHGMQPPPRSMTSTPQGFGGPRGFAGPPPQEFSTPPPRSMTADPYRQGPPPRMSPPRGASGPRGPGVRGPPPQQGGYNNGYNNQGQYGGSNNGGYGNAW